MFRTLLFSSLFPSSVRPGHGIFVETRLRELLNCGMVETRVVAPVPWFYSTHPRHGTHALMAATPRREVWNGIDVSHPRYLLPPRVGMTIAPLSMALASVGTARRLQREGFDFDLIDAHYYYPDGVAAVLLGKWLGKPVVVTARGSDVNLLPQYRLPRKMIQWAAVHAKASIGVSRALTEVLRGLGHADERLHVMRNGVDLVRFRPLPPMEARGSTGIEGEPVLLCVGNLVELKGHAIVIEALAHLVERHPNLRLVLVGDGPERKNLEALVARLGLQDHVQFVGVVPNDQLYRWYSAADVLVLASSREGWPNVLLEAMACGTPVVATRVSGIPEVVCDAVAGRLVDRRDPSGFASAIEDLLSHAPSRQDVRRYAQGFDWKATTEAQVALFAQLVEPARKVAHA